MRSLTDECRPLQLPRDPGALRELGSAVFTLGAIWWFCLQGGKNSCFPSIAKLAALAGLPVHKVKRDLNKLEAAQYIHRRRMYPRKSTTYTVTRKTGLAYDREGKAQGKFLTVSRSAAQWFGQLDLNYSDRIIFALFEWRRRGIEGGLRADGEDDADNVDLRVEVDGCLTISQIAAKCGVTRATARAALKRLVAAGLISVFNDDGAGAEFCLHTVNLAKIPELDGPADATRPLLKGSSPTALMKSATRADKKRDFGSVKSATLGRSKARPVVAKSATYKGLIKRPDQKDLSKKTSETTPPHVRTVPPKRKRELSDVEEYEAKLAKERQKAGGKHGAEGGRGNKKQEKPSVKSNGGFSGNGDARDKAAKLAKVANSKVSDAKRIKRESPQRQEPWVPLTSGPQAVVRTVGRLDLSDHAANERRRELYRQLEVA